MHRFKNLVFGGLLGSLAALLFAPKQGREVREMLRGRGRGILGTRRTELGPFYSAPCEKEAREADPSDSSSP